jgi:hypothetical protein
MDTVKVKFLSGGSFDGVVDHEQFGTVEAFHFKVGEKKDLPRKFAEDLAARGYCELK